MTDVLLVSLGSTAGLRAADAELAAALERAGASVAVVAASPQPDVRTLALTDLVWARAARAAARLGIEEHRPRAVVYSTVTAALLWPRAGAIRFDAPASGNRLGRHGVWQRPVERRRLREATLLVPQAPGALEEAASPRAAAVVVPIPVEPSGPPDGERDIAAITYAANPEKKGLDRVLAAWAVARRDSEELVVTGTERLPRAEGVRSAGSLAPDAYRALLRRARVFVTAPRREDYGVAQLRRWPTAACSSPPRPRARMRRCRLRASSTGAWSATTSPARCAWRSTTRHATTHSARCKRSPHTGARRSTRPSATSCSRGCSTPHERPPRRHRSPSPWTFVG